MPTTDRFDDVINVTTVFNTKTCLALGSVFYVADKSGGYDYCKLFPEDKIWLGASGFWTIVYSTIAIN